MAASSSTTIVCLLPAESITFTRSRPYWKNGNAHVEQKNRPVVRRLAGYDRYHARESLEQLDRLHPLITRYMNFLRPVMQLKEKHRQWARVRKRWGHGSGGGIARVIRLAAAGAGPDL